MRLFFVSACVGVLFTFKLGKHLPWRTLLSIRSHHLHVKGYQTSSQLRKQWDQTEESRRQISWLLPPHTPPTLPPQTGWLVTAAHSLHAKHSQRRTTPEQTHRVTCAFPCTVRLIGARWRSPLHLRKQWIGSWGYRQPTQTESKNGPTDEITARASETPQEPFLQVLAQMNMKGYN